MKKTLTLILAALMTLALCAAAAAETVYVSISNGAGELVMPCVAVEAGDLDSDGTLTIHDALTAAHDAAFEGGAAAGYSASMTDYGISLVKLWGEDNGGSYGYYINDTGALSLSDPISAGDHVKAYAYQDLAGWSDTYCYFQNTGAALDAGESLNLSLTALVYDANWNLVPVPVENALITINGEDSALLTDAAGACAVSFEAPGEYVISARSESMTLVPPVCVVTVK